MATHGRAFWILDNLKLLEQLAQQPQLSVVNAQIFAPETAWLTHSYGGGGFAASSSGENPEYGATVFFNIPANYDGKTPVTLSFLDAQGKEVRSFTLHARNKHEKKPSRAADVWEDHAQILARELREQTAIDPGMNAFQWDMRYSPAAEVIGFGMPTTDDIDDGVSGPTVLPGSYTVVLDYGGKRMQQPLIVQLDPRFHPAPGALEARLALATRIHATLDSLNRAVNAALAARNHESPAQRAQTDRVLADVVQMNIHSSEGDVKHEVRLRDYLAFLMNELDTAYQAPTAAEYATYDDLRAKAATAIEQLR